MNKQELIDKLASLVGSIEDFKGISTFHDGKYAGLEHALELIQQLDELQNPVESKITDEQAWNKVAEAYPESAQSLRNTLDNAVFGKTGEHQKPVVPKFVAEWFEENKDDLDTAIFGYLVFWKERYTDSVLYQWFDKSKNKPIETLIRMKDGYEVEEEPLYYVKLPVVYFNHLDLETYLMKDDRGNITIADNNDFDDMKFTESEIKAIDERYWAFAVPVEEVAEG